MGEAEALEGMDGGEAREGGGRGLDGQGGRSEEQKDELQSLEQN